MSLPPFPGRRLPRPDAALSVIVVGGGIAGIGAALGLASQGAAVTLVDAAPELGGACRAVEVEVPGRDPVSVDMGVSDFNRATFHQLAALLGELALPLTPVCQSASFRAPDGRWLWSSSPAGAEVAPGIDPRFTAEIARFKAEAPGVTDPRLPVGDWLRARGFSADFRRLYVVPRALGCFPSPGDDPEAVPIRALARFWGQHGLVGPGPADRVCVRGGMHRYLPAMRARLQALGVQLHLGEAVQRIDREPMKPLAVHTTRGTLVADRLVLAAPPAAALRLLAQPTAAERAVLAACRTQPGRVVLHRDPRLMPSSPERWAAYNYVVPGDTPVPGPTITFFPERLAQLQGPLPPLFVTLNPPIEPRAVLAEHVHAHPVFGRDDGMAAALARLQGTRRTWFCGAWTAEPFLHEQGLVSGLAVAAAIVAEPDRLAA
jgi:predicted NAD/FAD-binding protein